MSAREYTEHLGICHECFQVFRISRSAWELLVRERPDLSDEQREEEFLYCSSCSIHEQVPEEYEVPWGVLIGHEGNLAPEEDAEGNPIRMGWWYGTLVEDGGERVVTGPYRDAMDALRAARGVAA